MIFLATHRHRCQLLSPQTLLTSCYLPCMCHRFFTGRYFFSFRFFHLSCVTSPPLASGESSGGSPAGFTDWILQTFYVFYTRRPGRRKSTDNPEALPRTFAFTHVHVLRRKYGSAEFTMSERSSSKTGG